MYHILKRWSDGSYQAPPLKGAANQAPLPYSQGWSGFITGPITDDTANLAVAQLLFLSNEDAETEISIYINKKISNQTGSSNLPPLPRKKISQYNGRPDIISKDWMIFPKNIRLTIKIKIKT